MSVQAQRKVSEFTVFILLCNVPFDFLVTLQQNLVRLSAVPLPTGACAWPCLVPFHFFFSFNCLKKHIFPQSVSPCLSLFLKGKGGSTLCNLKHHPVYCTLPLVSFQFSLYSFNLNQLRGRKKILLLYKNSQNLQLCRPNRSVLCRRLWKTMLIISADGSGLSSLTQNKYLETG